MEWNPKLEAFWQAFLTSQPPGHTLPEKPGYVGYFGGDQQLADEIAPLVCGGIKTATSALMWEIEADGEEITPVGQVEIVTNWAGDPMCVIQITESEVRPFNEVDAKFVYDYGEGGRSLEWWHDNMWRYYSRTCASLGLEPDKTMPLNCVRFRLLSAW